MPGSVKAEWFFPPDLAPTRQHSIVQSKQMVGDTPVMLETLWLLLQFSYCGQAGQGVAAPSVGHKAPLHQC